MKKGGDSLVGFFSRPNRKPPVELTQFDELTHFDELNERYPKCFIEFEKIHKRLTHYRRTTTTSSVQLELTKKWVNKVLGDIKKEGSDIYDYLMAICDPKKSNTVTIIQGTPSTSIVKWVSPNWFYIFMVNAEGYEEGTYYTIEELEKDSRYENFREELDYLNSEKPKGKLPTGCVDFNEMYADLIRGMLFSDDYSKIISENWDNWVNKVLENLSSDSHYLKVINAICNKRSYFVVGKWNSLDVFVRLDLTSEKHFYVFLVDLGGVSDKEYFIELDDLMYDYGDSIRMSERKELHRFLTSDSMKSVQDRMS